MKLLLLVMVITMIGFGTGYATREVFSTQVAGQTTWASAAPYRDLDALGIEELVNEERIEVGLVALSHSEELKNSACNKAQHMIDNDYWEHVAPDGTEPWKFIDDAGYYYYEAGENLAYGFQTNEGVVDGWMNSPGHKRNLLGGYKDIGVCVKYGKFQGHNSAVVVKHLGIKPWQ